MLAPTHVENFFPDRGESFNAPGFWITGHPQTGNVVINGHEFPNTAGKRVDYLPEHRFLSIGGLLYQPPRGGPGVAASAQPVASLAALVAPPDLGASRPGSTVTPGSGPGAGKAPASSRGAAPAEPRRAVPPKSFAPRPPVAAAAAALVNHPVPVGAPIQFEGVQISRDPGSENLVVNDRVYRNTQGASVSYDPASRTLHIQGRAPEVLPRGPN